MINMEYVKAVVEAISSQPTKKVMDQASMYNTICLKCPMTKCSNNGFCAHMFNEWVINSNDPDTFLDILEAYVDNYMKVNISSVMIRTIVCDTCFKCKTTKERMNNTICSLLWIRQINRYSITDEQYHYTEPKSLYGPKCLCSKGIMTQFGNANQ